MGSQTANKKWRLHFETDKKSLFGKKARATSISPLAQSFPGVKWVFAPSLQRTLTQCHVLVKFAKTNLIVCCIPGLSAFLSTLLEHQWIIGKMGSLALADIGLPFRPTTFQTRLDLQSFSFFSFSVHVLKEFKLVETCVKEGVT